MRAPVRRRISAGRRGCIPRPARRDPRRRRAGGSRRRRGRARVGPARGGAQGDPAHVGRDRAPAAARRAAAGLPRRPCDRAVLRGAQGRVHPGARRAGPAVLGLPRLPPSQAAGGPRAWAGRHYHPHAHGQRVPDARAAREVLRPGHGSARGGRARHGRAPRHVRPGLRREVLRGRRLLRPRQLHRQLQPAAAPVRDRRAQGLAGAEPLLQHELRRRPHPPRRRAVVAPGRLRPAAGDERPGLRVVRVPGRHRPRQRLGVHRCPRPRLRPGEPLLHGDRTPRDRRRRAGADEGDRLPPAHERPHQELRGVPRLLAAALLRQRGRERRVLRLPRARRGDGPLAAAQVGGPGSRRRAADADDADARRAPPRCRPGQLHRAVQRDRRDHRRRHRLPPRRGQLPLRRRRPLRRGLAQGAGRSDSG